MGRHGLRKFSNRPITFESNRNGRFEFESNLEASQVPTLKLLYQIRFHLPIFSQSTANFLSVDKIAKSVNLVPLIVDLKFVISFNLEKLHSQLAGNADYNRQKICNIR